MTVKTSISLAETHAEFAKGLVEQGVFPSLSAVAQHGIELIRQRQEAEHADTEALKALLSTRAKGSFVSLEGFSGRVENMLARKRLTNDLGN